ncbi:MAG: tetratricopeptide repeat protein, partial [Candidatus Heimdallarchaeaceae archaeon]
KRELDFIADELEKSIKRVPLNYRLTLKLGKLYNAYFPFDKTKTKEAEYFLEKAIELSPRNQQAYWSLAQTKLFKNEIDEAISLAEEAVELEPKALQSHLILIQIIRIKDDRELLEEKITEALKINLGWASSIGQALGAELERRD